MKRWLPLVVLFLLFTGCSDEKLEKVSKGLKIAADTIGQLQQDAITWNEAGLTDEETTREILLVCNRANTAGLQAVKIVRALDAADAKLDVVSAQNILNLLKPIADSLDPGQLAFIVNINDPTTKQAIEAYLVLVRSTISTVMIVLASVG